MLNTNDILETIQMITDEHLDVRTVTMGISLLDCADPDGRKACEKIYRKITEKAKDLVKTAEDISATYGMPIVNKRISVTPIAMLLASAPDADPVWYAKTLDAAAKAVGVNFIGGYSALVHKGFSAGDERLIRSIPEALACTDYVCSSINVGSTKSGIITDLLTLTQMDSHSSHLRVTKVDLSALTEETVHTLQIAAEQKGQTLTADIAPGITLEGDSGKLMQIFYNLTDNAIKYTPENGHIAVRLAQSGANVLFAVTDDGIGIPEEDQKHIFERFYRVDKSRSRESGGTGLGLAIVKHILTSHGAQLELESELGKGTCITVTFEGAK